MVLNRIGVFFEEIKAEFQKIEWPKRKYIAVSSLIILGIVILFAAFISGIDILIAKVIFEIRGT